MFTPFAKAEQYESDINAVELEKAADNGTYYVRVINHTQYQLDCVIWNPESQYVYYRFMVMPESTGPWFNEPAGFYQWNCR